jgi:hypothetical protein
MAIVWSDPASINLEAAITWLGWCYRIKFLSIVPTTMRPGDVISASVEVRYFAVYNDGTCEIKPEGYAETKPVEIRLDSPTGPVLATAVVGSNGVAYFQSQLGTPIIIPEDLSVGPHQLFAVCEFPCYNDVACANCIGSDYGGCS